ncbi:MAG: DUF2203 domain-containing protein [Verrucomicrobia bacterium]|jgi:hypothetical protein|nr:DUF2203 domain-containing protein [Verrucomicrobiota bacterium]
MSGKFQYSRHYTLEEARSLIPQIKAWLDEINTLSLEQEECRNWQQAMFEQGHDLGGAQVEGEVKNLNRLMQILKEFQSRGILIRDLSRGLVDFPSIMGGEEAFLCWESGQTDIIYWHALGADQGDRKPV